mmetsp:Transcript_6866/g.11976  ORF Transcript_6866/g.11976 Transcript_6866/m.11976 type:complete len:217 (+) Transcript_6866:410-1060(+)
MFPKKMPFVLWPTLPFFFKTMAIPSFSTSTPCSPASLASSSTIAFHLTPEGSAIESGMLSPSTSGAEPCGKTTGTTTRSLSIKRSLSLFASIRVSFIFSFPPIASTTLFSMPRPLRREAKLVLKVPASLSKSSVNFLEARITSLASSAPLAARFNLEFCASTSRFHRNAIRIIPAISTAALISLSCRRSVLTPERPAAILPSEMNKPVMAPPPRLQ